MKYLLDTHTLLWYLNDDENLSEKAHKIIDTEDCFYCKVALWEIAIKQSLGKLKYKKSIPEIVAMCRQENFLSIPINENHIECIKTLDFIHRDPFDRLLIAIAQAENMTIITRDTIIQKYPVSTVW